MDKKKQVIFYHFTHKTQFYFISIDNVKIKKIVKVTKAEIFVQYMSIFMLLTLIACDHIGLPVNLT